MVARVRYKNEDFKTYRRMLKHEAKLLKEKLKGIIFHESTNFMYMPPSNGVQMPPKIYNTGGTYVHGMKPFKG